MVLRRIGSEQAVNNSSEAVAASRAMTSMNMPMVSLGLFGTLLLVKAIVSTEADAASSVGVSAVSVDVQPTQIARAVNGSLVGGVTGSVNQGTQWTSTGSMDGLVIAQATVQTTTTTSSSGDNEFLMSRTRELMALDNRTVDDVAARLKEIIKARYESDSLNIETMANVDDLRRQVAEFEALLNSANSQKDALNAEKADLESRLNLMLSERDNAQFELDALANQMEAQLGSVQALQSETAFSSEQLAEKDRALAELETNLNALEFEKEQAEQALKNGTTSSNELLAEKDRALAELSTNLSALGIEKEQAEQDANAIAAQLAERNQQLEDLNAELAGITADRDAILNSKATTDSLIDEKENRLADLRSQYDQLVLSNDNVKDEASQLTQMLAEKEVELADVTAQLQSVTVDHETARNQGADLQALVAEKEGSLLDLQSQVNALAAERDSARTEIAAVNGILNQKSDLIDELTVQMDQLNNEKNMAAEQLSVMQSKLSEVDTLASNFQQERDNLAGTLSLFEDKATDYNSAFLSEQQAHENTKATVAALEKDTSDLQSELNGVTSERDVLLSQRQHLEATSNDLNGRLLGFEKELDTRQHELQAALSSISNLNSQIAMLGSERDSANASIESLQEEIAGLHSELTSTQEAAEQRLLSATNEFADERQALETMLGKRDQGIADLNEQLASLKIEKDQSDNFFNAEVSDRDDKIIDLKTRISELEASRQQLTGLQSQGEMKLGEMQSQIAGLLTKRDLTAEKLAKLKDVNGQLTDQLKLTSEKLEVVTADGAQQLGSLKEKITVLEINGANAEDEVLKLSGLNSELEAELNATRQKVEMVMAEGSDQVLALRAQVDELEARANDLAIREAAASEKVSGLEFSNQSLTEQLELAQTENLSNVENLDKLRFNLSKYEADLGIASQQLYDLRAAQKMAEDERDAVIAEAEALRVSLTGELNDAKLENITVQQTRADNSIPIRLGNADFFAPGSAQLTKKGGEKLTKLAEIIQSYDNRRIVVEGHTDNVPIGAGLKRRFPSNWELSVARAAAAVRHMQFETQIDPRNLSAAGFGEFKPVAPNESEHGRQQNRRVEVVLYPTEDEFKDETTTMTGIDE